MTYVKLRALNSIPEFKTREGIDEVKSIFINQEFPDDYSNKEIHKFTNKFRDFDVDNNQLIYKPAKLRVVYPDEREGAMKKVFEDKKRGLGLGLNAFYHQVCMSYLNIQKKHTDAFLENQGEYRVQKIQKKRINAPVKATAPNRRWGVDLIDMNAYPLPQNDQHNWIMTVVDFFSGYVFVRPMTNKEAPTIRDWLDHICQTDARNTYPKAIHADGEFQKAKVLKDWYDYHGIKLIKSTSYTPTSNGKVERMNRQIRKKIKAGFIRHNNLVWKKYLQEYAKNINNQQQARTKRTAKQLWRPGHPSAGTVQDPIPPISDKMTEKELFDYQVSVLRKEYEQYSTGRELIQFQKGEKVRLSLLRLQTELRKMRKSGMSWGKVAMHWTPHVYEVNKVHEATDKELWVTYSVKDIDTGEVIRSNNRIMRFYPWELTEAGDVPLKFTDNERSLYLNRV